MQNISNNSSFNIEQVTELLATQRAMCADAFWNNRFGFMGTITEEQCKKMTLYIENYDAPGLPTTEHNEVEKGTLNFKPLDGIETLRDCLYEYGRYYHEYFKNGNPLPGFSGNIEIECIEDFIEAMKDQPFFKPPATTEHISEDSELFVWVKAMENLWDKWAMTVGDDGFKYLTKDLFLLAIQDKNFRIKPIEHNINDQNKALLEEIRQIKAVIIHFATLDKMPTLPLLNREGLIEHVVERAKNILNKYPPKHI